MVTRRNFLALAGGLVVLAACGGGSDDSSSSGTTGNTLNHDHPDENFTDLSPIVLSGDLYASAVPQRFAFAMSAKQGFASGDTVTLAVAPQGTKATQFVPTTLYEAGLPQHRGVYVVDTVFDKEGIWDGIADRKGDKLPFAIQVKNKADAPTVGTAAPLDASPTTANPLGVDPICTRDPMCPLHDQSLDTIIGKGKPVAVLFATPARCQSKYCGPVLDSLLPLVDTYKDRVNLVHVDIYKNLRTNETSPTVTAWNIPSEPWFFGIDAAGKITTRLDGAIGQDEMKAALDQLSQ
jgi:hypothetical protein